MFLLLIVIGLVLAAFVGFTLPVIILIALGVALGAIQFALTNPRGF